MGLFTGNLKFDVNLSIFEIVERISQLSFLFIIFQESQKVYKNQEELVKLWKFFQLFVNRYTTQILLIKNFSILL